VELYLYSPICLHGVLLNLLSTGTALPITYYDNVGCWLDKKSSVAPMAHIKEIIMEIYSGTFWLHFKLQDFINKINIFKNRNHIRIYS
jgi:hypothetical protein